MTANYIRAGAEPQLTVRFRTKTAYFVALLNIVKLGQWEPVCIWIIMGVAGNWDMFVVKQNKYLHYQ